MKKCLSLMGLPEKHIGHFNRINPIDRLKSFLDDSNNTSGYIFDRTPRNICRINHMAATLDSVSLASKNFKLIFCIRNPCDRLVSGAHWAKKYPNTFPTAANLPINEVIMSLIDENYHFAIQKKYGSDTLKQYGVEGYLPYLGWLTAPNMYVVKFENLVGPHGGGSEKLQLKEIANIAKHLEIKLSEEKIQSIAHNLFGDRKGTFREGQIGSWEKHFTPEHIEALKKNKQACKIIVDLGYEKNNFWLNIGKDGEKG